MEIYKDIEGYEGYQVSNHGNVKSLERECKGKSRKDKILKPFNNKDGYLRVGLYKEGKLKNHYVHRLVAEAFIENHNNFREINHRDEDKANNCVSNLEWCDRKYNINYGTRNEKISKQVLCLETNKIYPSLKEVQRQTGFAKSNISNAQPLGRLLFQIINPMKSD